jgi:hypothetical protein
MGGMGAACGGELNCHFTTAKNVKIQNSKHQPNTNKNVD